jgi:hypothetical protein
MESELLPASQGVGPLLQRDYWAVLSDCRMVPVDVIRYIRDHFSELAPAALVEITAPTGGIAIGAELDICIKPGYECGVRVVHDNGQSFTLATLLGHPEAGRITFGAYRSTAGDLILHIRSRARSSTFGNRFGFLLLGDAMQTMTWADFITNTAAAVGTHVQGVIHADTKAVDPLPEDDYPMAHPTFLAVGD